MEKGYQEVNANDHPIQVLMGAGQALRDLAEDLERKEDYGLAFLLKQVGGAVYETGFRLFSEKWEATPAKEIVKENG